MPDFAERRLHPCCIDAHARAEADYANENGRVSGSDARAAWLDPQALTLYSRDDGGSPIVICRCAVARRAVAP